MSKLQRLNDINDLIQFISERGRMFFYSKYTEHVGYMVIRNNRLYYIDPGTGKRVYAYDGFSHDGFSHGGTLWALVCELSYYIRTGKYSNGMYGYEGFYSGDWGQGEEVQNEIIQYAEKIGYL